MTTVVTAGCRSPRTRARHPVKTRIKIPIPGPGRRLGAGGSGFGRQCIASRSPTLRAAGCWPDRATHAGFRRQPVSAPGSSRPPTQRLPVEAKWGVTYPGFTHGLILIVPAARSDNHFRAMVDAMVALITLDPAYQGGRYAQNPTEGIRRAGTIYFPGLYSDAYLETLATPSSTRRRCGRRRRPGSRHGTRTRSCCATARRATTTPPSPMAAT